MMTSIEMARHMTIAYDVNLSKSSLHALADLLVCRKCKKGDRLLNEGEVCTCMRYIEKGLIRQLYYKYEKDLTEHISYEGGMVICLESYLKGVPTRLMIEALEAATFWEIDKKRLEELALERADIGLWYRKVFEISLIESQIKADILRFEPAHERYARLMKHHPEILKRAPLVYIASLLQMTPETLSRVRSAVLKGGEE